MNPRPSPRPASTSLLTSAHPALDILGHAIFWGWNLLFFAFVFCGLAPVVFIDLMGDAIRGQTPWDFALVSALFVHDQIDQLTIFFLLEKKPNASLR